MLTIVAALASVCILALDPPADSEVAAAADRLAAMTLSENGAAGLSIAVVRNGRIILSKGYGLAEIEHDVPVNEDTLFRVGSITKQFTAAAIMRLVEQGKIGLDDLVTGFVPDFNTRGREITVRHLLTHTSGIKSYTELKQVMVDQPEHEFSHQEMLDLVQNEPLAFEPGARADYCNTGYYLLGMIIEKVSGEDYCTYLSHECFEPLGLARTRCDSNTQIIKNRAQGYALDGSTLVNDRGLATSTPFAAGMLLASAHDLVVWADALAAGKVVTPASYAQMSSRTELAGGGFSEYGFGLIIDSLDGHARVQHGGGIFGFNAMLARFPDDGVTIAVLSNSQAISAGRLADDLSREALGIVVPNEPAAVAVSETEAAKCEGVFEFPAAGWGITISRREGKLFSKASDDRESEMIYLGKGEFRTILYEKTARLVFELSGDTPSPSLVLHEGGAALTAKRKEP